jgi:hypothetical protein
MELFLNLCWLSLLLPAWLLWRQRTFSAGSVIRQEVRRRDRSSSFALSVAFLCCCFP